MKYRVTYNSAKTEDVEADRWDNQGSWVVFYKKLTGMLNAEKVLQVKNAEVKRVELID